MPSSSITPELKAEEALALVAKRKIAKAEVLCKSALAGDPDNDQWLLVQGQILLAKGNTDDAVTVLSKAATRNREDARIHHALGNALHNQKKIDRAITSYRRALRLQPGLAEAQNDLGTAYFDKHWLKEAEEAFREAIRLKADHDAAFTNLGAVLRAQGKLKEARSAYQSALWLRLRNRLGRWLPAIPANVAPTAAPPAPRSAGVPAAGRDSRIDAAQALLHAGRLDEAESLIKPLVNEQPDNAEAVHLLGYILGEQGNHAVAMSYLSRAIALSPGVAKYHNNLGNSYQREGLTIEAVGSYERAIKLDPGLAIAHNNLGAALRGLSQYEKSLAACNQAIALDPGLGSAHSNKGEALYYLERYEEAISSYKRALEMMPDHIDTWNSLGRIHLEHLSDVDEAERCFLRSVELSPNDEAAHHNLGVVEQLRGNFDAALARFRHAQRLNPVVAQANFSESLLHLLRGDFEKGWVNYHWRLVLKERIGMYPRVATAYWDGGSLAGRSILIFGEQGLGDELMFASCIGEVISSAASAVIACEPRLVKIFQRSFPTARIIGMHAVRKAEWIKDAPQTDVIAAMGDLPALLRKSADSFPDHRGYLKADPQRVQYWRDRLASLGPGPKIGISWKGGTKFSWKLRRSLSLDRLLPIVGDTGAQYVSLQYGNAAAEIAPFEAKSGIKIHHWPEAIADYDETAALCCALDMTVSVCTAVVHLNGALGKPVWVLAPFMPEWRYGFSGEKMPWYPSARIFRQDLDGEWDGVIKKVSGELREHGAGRV